MKNLIYCVFIVLPWTGSFEVAVNCDKIMIQVIKETSVISRRGQFLIINKLLTLPPALPALQLSDVPVILMREHGNLEVINSSNINGVKK